jgi:hypothetical protein
MSKSLFQHRVQSGTIRMNDPKPPKRKSTRRAAGDSKPARLDRDIQHRIGDKLRAMYGDIVDQGVPDRFTTLLQQLEDRTKDKDP